MQTNHEGGPVLNIKEDFNNHLEAILQAPLTVENIEVFADDALEAVVELNIGVIESYKKIAGFEDISTSSDMEDLAYAHFSLPSLNEVLERITEVQEIIQNLKEEIFIFTEQTETVLTPPDNTVNTISPGEEAHEPPKLFPRLLTLAYILKKDFDICGEEVVYTRGETTRQMVRKEPYVRIEIPSLDRVVYICDEEGNATYVFGAEMLSNIGVSIDELDNMTKQKKKSLIEITPEVGLRIKQSSDWRRIIQGALADSFEEQIHTDLSEPVSEFSVREKYLEFKKFISEVRDTYILSGEPTSIARWYKAESCRHNYWPADPERLYKNVGWKSWPETIAGKEKIRLLSFEDFISEVISAYQDDGSPVKVVEWYREQYINHRGWPAQPNDAYKDKGWKGYPETIGQIKRTEPLLFDDFTKQVTNAYKVAGRPTNTRSWYKVERINHPTWPARPDIFYKDNGWKGYSESITEKPSLLPFEHFAKEVRAAYLSAENPENLKFWYEEEYPVRAGWPSNPQITYKDLGWKSWPETIAGKEKKNFLQYGEFIKEVRLAYIEGGRPSGIKDWYKLEQQNRNDWPVSPDMFYKDDGWKGLPDLVNRDKRYVRRES